MPDATLQNTANSSSIALLAWFTRLIRGFLMLAFPVVVVLTGIRLVATEAFIRFEYHRPGFPADRYGFSREERLEYAPYAIRYLLSDRGIAYLGQLTFEDGLPLFNERELRHMEDVKDVTRTAFRIHLVLGTLYLICVIGLAWQRSTRPLLRQGLLGGAILTMTLIVTLVVLMLANWDYFFDTFHAVFFAGDSWLFRTSDTLIRLFPEQFWFDAALAVGGFTLLAALSIVGGVWYWENRQQPGEVNPPDGTGTDPVPDPESSS